MKVNGFEAVLWFVLILSAAKLARVIDWSWWVVLAPIWLPVAVIIGIPLLIMFLILVYGAVMALIGWWASK